LKSMDKNAPSSDLKAYLVLNNQIFHLHENVTKIGRKLDNHFVIQDPLISRNHAEIVFRDDNFFIVDLDSTGGTFLNNKKISESKLFSGDIILLANVPVLFVIDKKMVYSQGDVDTGTLSE